MLCVLRLVCNASTAYACSVILLGLLSNDSTEYIVVYTNGMR